MMREVKEFIEELELIIKESDPSQDELYTLKNILEESILIVDNEISLRKRR